MQQDNTAVETTISNRLNEQFRVEASKNPWDAFLNNREAEAREICLEIIREKSPAEAPHGWLENVITRLSRTERFERDYHNRLLTWYLSASTTRPVEVRALTLAAQLLIEGDRWQRDEISTLIVKKLGDRTSRLLHSTGCDLYWETPKLREAIGFLLLSAEQDDEKGGAYRTSAWKNTLKALNQITGVEDVSFLSYLKDLLGKHQSNVLRPLIKNGGVEQEGFRWYATFDNPAILKG
jgi:hypothetical protein